MEKTNGRERNQCSAMKSECVVNHEEKMKKFYSLLQDEFVLYSDMLQLYSNESRLIEEGRIDDFTASLREKEEYLNKEMYLEKVIAPLKNDWNRCRGIVSEELQLQIQELIDRFKALVEKLVAHQKENEDLLAKKNQEDAKSLSAVRKGRHFNKTYSIYGDNVPRSHNVDKTR